ncbi:MAG: DUF1150 family protein [Proteobacteria bacterium]|nr:DUF1150 family protein [Pseudomonadota bacterium]MCH8187233.1 DUF1150 family protein [Pseudomonadota bacterium]
MVNLSELKSMSPEAFAYLGAPALAYVKEVKVEGEPAYAVHAADGTAIAIFDNRDYAFAAAKQNDLDAVSVH